MSKWKTCTLGDVAEFIQTGPFGSQLHQSDYSEAGTPVVMPQDMKDGRIVTGSIVRVEQHHVERLKRHKLKEGDIVYSRRGDVGRSAYISAAQGGWLCGTGCLLVRLDKTKVYPRYIAYYLRQKSQIEWVENNAVGITMLNLNTGILAAAPLRIPNSVVEQKRIADELSALDEKIELNNELIRMLEEQAQLVYDYWFMQFDFPDENGKPYRSSGGKMVWCEHLKQEIPEGWAISDLVDIVETNPTERLPKGTCSPYIELDTLSTERYLTGLSAQREYNGSGMKFRNNDVLLVRITPSLENGKTGLVHDLPEGVVGFGSTEYIVMRGRHMPLPAYCITLARSPKFRAYAISKMRGTSGRKRLDYHDVNAYRLPLPPESVLKQFEEICVPLLDRIHTAMVDNQALIALRDFLLPLLMSGQVKVKPLAV